ncbi:unnamed protein product [Vicia faba]|uniref:NB-ARC domain-containing protein n=1 Tax=Vicia faba TaxID=3906 RepID=A0AAV0Z379_VICFA|nr:unnamed protein product [Vicia faba]
MNAMKVLANLVDWDVRNMPESIEIETIVQAVIKTLNHKFSGFTSDLVGMQPHIKELEKFLKLSSKDDGFWVLGIWGMSGVGKTTHATLLYDRISYQFDARCFINNTSKLYMDGGIVAVQRQILGQALDERNLDSYDTCEIAGIMLSRLQSGLKVLLVLDNVDQLEQLQELVPLLNSSDASELFFRKAFKGEYQSSNCVELIPEILKYVQNLPLAIKVVGSFLCTRDATQWRDALDRLKNNPDNKIMDVLQMSADGLQHENLGKKLFGTAISMTQYCGVSIWRCNDFYHVMETKTGTYNNVKAVVLDQKENFSKCRAEGFSNMSNLVLLMLYHNNFSGNLDFLSNNLCYLLWHGYPFISLPSNFEPVCLVELNRPDSS